MKRAIEMYGQCIATTRVGYRCGNAAYKNQLCVRHMDKPIKRAAPAAPKAPKKPRTKTIYAMFPGLYVEAERGDARVQLRWVDALGAFEIRTIHKGLRDQLNIWPGSSNVVYIKVGEKL